MGHICFGVGLLWGPPEQLGHADIEQEGPEKASEQGHVQGGGHPGGQGGAGQSSRDGGEGGGLVHVTVF